ncbi:hypothetical protein HAX54_013321 [Datura stramonium]|uniref:Uncharacterized protein n=1 Tax=Datura stramonium TaxID=4076 RepID=A0ABS8RIJ9_DATST|nr:hypothetical protein [Datura stramonium]
MTKEKGYTLQTFLRLIVIGVFPFFLESETSSIVSSGKTTVASSSSSPSSSSSSTSSYSNELSSDSVSLLVTTSGNKLLLVCGGTLETVTLRSSETKMYAVCRVLGLKYEGRDPHLEVI